MTHTVKVVPKPASEREQLRRRLLELIQKNEAQRRQAPGKRASE